MDDRRIFLALKFNRFFALWAQNNNSGTGCSCAPLPNWTEHCSVPTKRISGTFPYVPVGSPDPTENLSLALSLGRTKDYTLLNDSFVPFRGQGGITESELRNFWNFFAFLSVVFIVLLTQP